MCPAKVNPRQPNASRYCAALTLRNGQLSLDETASRFYPRFPPAQPVDADKVEATLTEEIKSGLGGLQKLYVYAFGDPKQSSTLSPASMAPVENLTTTSWREAAGLLDQWAMCPELPAGRDCTRNDSSSMFSGASNELLRALQSTTPMFKAEDQGSGANRGYLMIGVEDPCPDLTKPDAVRVEFDKGGVPFAQDGDVLSGLDVRQWLNRHYGHRFWISDDVDRWMTDLLSLSGLQPLVYPSAVGANERSIRIVESRRLGAILLPATFNDDLAKDRQELDKVLYVLLPWEMHHRYSESLVKPVTADGGTTVARKLQYQDLLGKGQPLPYVDLFDLQDRQAELAGLGYSLSNADEGDAIVQNQNVKGPEDLVVSIETKDKASANKSPNNAPQETKPKVDAGGGQKPQRQPQISPAPVEPDPPNTLPTPQQKQSYSVAGGFNYRPGQGVRPLVSLQLSQTPLLSWLNKDNAVAFQGGTSQTQGVGSGEVSLDYIWFGKLHRRLSVDVIGGTDSTNARILGGLLTDERRTGGSAHVELDLIRRWRGHLLRWTGDGRRETVALSRSGKDAGKTDLTTLQTGLMWVYASSATLHSTTIQVTPTIKFGTGASASEPPYQLFSVRGTWEELLSADRMLTVEVSGVGQIASKRTPLFELPSLGGGDVLRGFRQDDALGRRLWSIQGELWFPVPGSINTKDGLPRFLRQNIRLAAFADVGGVGQTQLDAGAGTSSKPGTRLGPGLGIRYIKGRTALKLDWAYGVGQGAFGAGHGRAYLGASTTTTF